MLWIIQCRCQLQSALRRYVCVCVCLCGLTANFDNSSVATYTRRIRNAQPSHIFIFMSQIFHMPLLLSYFQAAHCLRALIVLLCTSSCSCLQLQLCFCIEQLLAQVWAAAQANSCPNHEQAPFPVQAAIQSQLVWVRVCVCVWGRNWRANNLLIFLQFSEYFHVSWPTTIATITTTNNNNKPHNKYINTGRIQWQCVERRQQTSARII